jgi:hypothetical protein
MTSSSEEANRIAESGLAHVICGRQDQLILSYESLALMVYVFNILGLNVCVASVLLLSFCNLAEQYYQWTMIE